MKWLKRAWKELPGEVISTCWRHCGLLVVAEDVADGIAVYLGERVLVSGLQNHICELVTDRQRLSAADLFNPEAEDNCIQVLDEEDYIDLAFAEASAEVKNGGL